MAQADRYGDATPATRPVLSDAVGGTLFGSGRPAAYRYGQPLRLLLATPPTAAADRAIRRRRQIRLFEPPATSNYRRPATGTSDRAIGSGGRHRLCKPPASSSSYPATGRSASGYSVRRLARSYAQPPASHYGTPATARARPSYSTPAAGSGYSQPPASSYWHAVDGHGGTSYTPSAGSVTSPATGGSDPPAYRPGSTSDYVPHGRAQGHQRDFFHAGTASGVTRRTTPSSRQPVNAFWLGQTFCLPKKPVDRADRNVCPTRARRHRSRASCMAPDRIGIMELLRERSRIPHLVECRDC